LASKPLGQFVSGLTSKSVATIFRFGLKTGSDDFSRFSLKIGGVGVFCFVPLTRQLQFYDLVIKIIVMVS
jgi:hypothetical protein